VEEKEKNDLTQALDDVLNIVNVAFFAPKFFSKIYLTLNPRYRRTRITLQKYIYRMISLLGLCNQ